MCIYHHIKNWTVIPKEANNPPVTVTCDGDQGVSSVSASSCASTPKVKRIWMTVYAKQTSCQAYKEKQAHYDGFNKWQDKGSLDPIYMLF
jgi:hypothetical protein